jgi:hypothetical protein
VTVSPLRRRFHPYKEKCCNIFGTFFAVEASPDAAALECVMEELLLESPEKRGEAYRERAEAAITSASRARSEDIAACYSRLADIWGRLAATVATPEVVKYDAR